MKKFSHIIGIDEAGRGPIAGPVAVAVFLIPSEEKLSSLKKVLKTYKNDYSLRDSKQLSERERNVLFKEFVVLQKRGSIHFACSLVHASTIDRTGITSAIKCALKRSLQKLKKNFSQKNTMIYLDGSLHAPAEYQFQETIIKGDQRKLSIACASIVAKVTRDRYMKNQATKFPGYLWEQNKGYGTKGHYKGIEKLGITKLHRKSFLGKKNEI